MSSGVPGPGVPSLPPREVRRVPPPRARQEGSDRRVGLYVLFGCGGAALLALLILLAGFGLIRFGFAFMAEQVKTDLRGNAVIVEHLGRLDSLEVDFMGSVLAPGADDFVFRARGTKGTGVVRATCVTVDADTEKVTAGTLQLESGEMVDLFPAPSGG